ncbi:MAG: universal stress protein [Phycisphaerales bacterium]|nr:universal stress protein [Phycisphaerales bacterium]
MLKRILVALSGSPFTTSAIRHATELGAGHHARVFGVTVTDLERLEDIGPVPVGAAAAAHALAEHRLATAREALEISINEFTAACQTAKLDSTLYMEEGDCLEKFMSLSRYSDLTVIGLRGLFEYGVVQNPRDTILKAIARGLRPILAVAEQYRPVKRVMVAYNGSIESAKAMKSFVWINAWPGVEVRVICIGDKRDVPGLLADASEYFTEHGYSTDSEHRAGDPHKELLKAAGEWKADMIVMGATSRSKLGRLIWGDTALDVLENSTIPVFLSQ